MSYSIKTIGKPADVAALVTANLYMPPGVKAALLETINDITPAHGDLVCVEAYGHFGGGYSSIGKLEVNYVMAAPPVAPPANNDYVAPGCQQFVETK